jgi:hypothetical protein
MTHTDHVSTVGNATWQRKLISAIVSVYCAWVHVRQVSFTVMMTKQMCSSDRAVHLADIKMIPCERCNCLYKCKQNQQRGVSFQFHFV